MIISDSHMHSDLSSDSDAPMESMILKAIDLGLKSICFTEHLDYDYPADENGIVDFQLDTQKYSDTFFKLKDRFSNQIELLFGIEFGLQPHLGNRYQKVADAYPFDFIIGSSHLVMGADPYYPQIFKKYSEEDIYGKYFETIAENIQNFSNFSTYGHIDYIVRYGPDKNAHYSYEKYKDVLDLALKAIIDHNIALEINTAGLKYGLGFPHPQTDVLKRYQELGGELITIGSDAHAPEHIAYDFKHVNELLLDLGFKYYALYKEQKPVMISL